MGLLETQYPGLRIRDSGAPNCLRGHGPFRAGSRIVCAVQKFCRQNARASVPVCGDAAERQTPLMQNSFAFVFVLFSGTQYYGVAGDRIPLAVDSAPADP